MVSFLKFSPLKTYTPLFPPPPTFVSCLWVWKLVMLKEENRLRVFVNGMLRKIFVPKWDQLKGDWRRLRNNRQICGSVYFSIYIFGKQVGSRVILDKLETDIPRVKSTLYSFMNETFICWGYSQVAEFCHSLPISFLHSVYDISACI